MKPLVSTTGPAGAIRTAAAKLFRLASLGVAGLALCQALQAADLLNGGFDSVNGSDANYWSSGGSPAGALPGTIRGGNAGGFGWSSGYFGGTYPTNNTFASTVGGPVRQDLSGADNTFVEGVTYAVSMQIFGSSNYGQNTPTMWSLAFTGDGTVVKRDHWFSDEFAASAVSAGNGGTIPDDHIVNVGPGGSTGLKTVTITYTATAADAGKVIGVQLAGPTQTLYTLASGAPSPSDYYGMMDTVTFSVGGPPPILLSFTDDSDLAEGQPINFSWSIENPGSIQTLTLDDGSGPVDVKPNTDTGTGIGGIQLSPAANTTYTLTLNGTGIRTLAVKTAKISSFTSNVPFVTGPDYKATLNWNIEAAPGSTVTISDGTNTTDVTANTVDGVGTADFVVPSSFTIFTLNVNNGTATSTARVVRSMPSDPDKFSVNLDTVYTNDTFTVSWKNSGNASGSWVAVYKLTDTTGVQYATQWQYISGYGGATGSINFSGLAPGQYYTVLFVDGNYTIEQGPIVFTVTGTTRPLPLAVTSFSRFGDTCYLTWNSEPGATYDIFASDSLDTWETIQANYPSTGTITNYSEDLDQLPDGPPAKRFYRISKSAP